MKICQKHQTFEAIDQGFPTFLWPCTQSQIKG